MMGTVVVYGLSLGIFTWLSRTSILIPKRLSMEDRIRWRHMTCSLLHSMAAFGMAFAYYVRGCNASCSLDRLYGQDCFNRDILTVSLGFFTWDLVICIIYRKLYGNAMLLHALVCLGALSKSLRSKSLMHYSTLVLLYEASTIPLDLYWFGKRRGLPKALLTTLKGITAVLFLVFRLVIGGKIVLQICSDLARHWGSIPWDLLVATLVTATLSTTLNWMWFCQMVRQRRFK